MKRNCWQPLVRVRQTEKLENADHDKQPHSKIGNKAMKLFLAAAALTVSLSSAAVADDGAWTDREICRAATKTYFFLSSKPLDALDRGAGFYFRSAAGNIYSCRVEGAAAIFFWMNKSGEQMESRSTTFSVDGSRLNVKTDIMDEAFVAE
jgi:hypothetical protein